MFGADVLRVGIVVASELPRDRTTLLVRIMAGGPLLAPAVHELVALPADAIERVREAFRKGTALETLFRNYHREGRVFWSRLRLLGLWGRNRHCL